MLGDDLSLVSNHVHLPALLCAVAIDGMTGRFGPPAAPIKNPALQ
ncbi:hypothetical protein D779_3810 [Imhoffiella purpurea]|uniref:Uncharacterized protein n=1 Tax=Imhoffiella purpurea TaxID=1249627 RepID=W9V1K6_9GAMM|nr:hypothetical protein D779_3810 [Imhoffiella purpurea]